MQKYEKQTEREGTGSHVDCSCARDSEIISMETRFSQAQVLRLCPLSPWQVTLSLRMFFFFCFVFPEVHRSVSALLTHSAWEEQRNLHPFFFFFFSQRYQVLLKCGRLRTLTGSHLQWKHRHEQPHAHIQRCIQTHTKDIPSVVEEMIVWT